VGIIHAWIEGPGEQYDVDRNNLAFNIGGGVRYALNTRLGIRSDWRYIRGFVDEDKDEAYRKGYGFLPRDARCRARAHAVKRALSCSTSARSAHALTWSFTRPMASMKE
jgi:hypothetical protein